ncbi:carbamoyltransferase family protein [Rhodopirellula sp. JC639]|uniref:carbamoyltransferase family protein n=1 Tax=Stieleria mannarensis TaxID=2755585 RepID=UPI001602494C|nr:carbamoyltransferase [Rhodopirellula sp. JC639]
MTAILGLSAFYHDSAAALLVDGEVVAAAQEERFTRTKHDAGFPTHAIDFCLTQAGITAGDLDYVGFYEKPLLKFDRLLETYLSFAPQGFRSFWKAMPAWMTEKLHLRREIRRGLGNQYRRRIAFCHHHQSHAASAFYPSPFDQAAILTMDGVGEWATTTMGMGRGNSIELTDEIRFPHSLGLLYSAFTYYCGFRVNSGEYKLMGLAPYGQPKYVDLIKDRLVTIHDDGSFHLNLDYFGYCQSLRMTTPKFHRLFGRSPRQRDSEIEGLDRDLAASVQVVTEEIVLRSARHLHEKTKATNLCLAGGVALNCVANGRVLREGPFDSIWIQPAAGDAGGALGISQFIWHQLLDKPRRPLPCDSQRGSLLGPEYSSEQVRAVLDRRGAVYESIADPAELDRRTAALLADGMVVGRFDGRAEFGPRALGNRSILGDPRRRDMQSTMNLKIKFRESFRPFAPAVLLDHVGDHFDLDDGQTSPYMLLVCQTKSDALPAVTHVDGSARVQTVDKEKNPRFEALLAEFYRQTGCPVLINTSFNVRGEPIVGSPDDAYRCFMKTHMDALVVGDCLLIKERQREAKAE